MLSVFWTQRLHFGPRIPQEPRDGLRRSPTPGGALRRSVVKRLGRPVPLLSLGGTLILINPAGETLDTRMYGASTIGQIIQFD